jgi:rSAM/selenodomain-associated transferase 1
MVMTDKRCVILFVKLLEKGRVKSRLAQHLDEDLVLRLYESMVLDTIDMLKRGKAPFRICFDPPDKLEPVRKWLGQEHVYLPQNGNDLGERMEQAFIRVFAEGVSEALLIGSDIPGLKGSIIDEAFESLSSHDSIIGPANDGGYYLIGFRRNSFDPAVFHDTLDGMSRRSLKVHALPECTDMDTIDDLKSFLAEYAGKESPDSRTFALLKGWQGGILK